METTTSMNRYCNGNYITAMPAAANVARSRRNKHGQTCKKMAAEGRNNDDNNYYNDGGDDANATLTMATRVWHDDGHPAY